MQIGPVSPSAPIPFSPEGKEPAQQTLPAMQYYVLTSLIEAENRTLASAMPAEDTPEATPVVAAAPVGEAPPTKEQVAKGLEALAIIAKMLALYEAKVGDRWAFEIIDLKGQLDSIKPLDPQMKGFISKVRLPWDSSGGQDWKAVEKDVLAWVKTNKGTILDICKDEKKTPKEKAAYFMDFIWFLTQSMRNPDMVPAVEEILGSAAGSGQFMYQRIAEFVLAYFFITDAGDTEQLKKDIKSFNALMPRDYKPPVDQKDFFKQILDRFTEYGKEGPFQDPPKWPDSLVLNKEEYLRAGLTVFYGFLSTQVEKPQNRR